MASLLSASLSLLANAVPQSVGSLVTPAEGRQPSASQVLSQAALSVPKTLYNRFAGTPEHPEWAMYEEVIFNAVRIVATHAESAHPSSRTMVTRLMNLQSRLCSEKITQVSTYYDEGDVKGYWIGKPVDMSKDIVMVYLHGGSFITGHPLQACHALADLMSLLRKEKKLESRIYAVEYPLAPEQPYPAGLNSCVRAVRWIIDAVGAKNIVLVGDSAGGNLTLATLLRLRDHFPHAHTSTKFSAA
ncbi:alpha/beta-hydrolase [Gonapodya prolifera JEL478]|uniref:Alpha/beta-hydrolase n=1 Tax=Gonapodya prolifera (strain JEL478) TaxID=1344416 RepID=A0A139AJT0_GONPJ|nr:alpha/beta-hydrolase [Gonapodya prolifera JEL478]|eukprot:KXS17009.1 alpha/beta-hydrolase [Gonapodya prolifera JEL478]